MICAIEYWIKLTWSHEIERKELVLVTTNASKLRISSWGHGMMSNAIATPMGEKSVGYSRKCSAYLGFRRLMLLIAFSTMLFVRSFLKMKSGITIPPYSN
jgi:hypothetical protein